jgi:pSer/pThr/pTyr-binding forkhead associated (FHA) protein
VYPVVVIRQPGRTPIHLQVREAIEIGRECSGVLLADPRVSRRHLVLAPTDGGPAEVAVLDLGSMNGTLLAGVRLTREVVLRAGEQVELGDTTIRLVLEASGTAAVVDPGMVAIDEVERATTVLPTAAPSVRAVGPGATPADPWRRPPADRDTTR